MLIDLENGLFWEKGYNIKAESLFIAQGVSPGLQIHNKTKLWRSDTMICYGFFINRESLFQSFEQMVVAFTQGSHPGLYKSG